MKRNKFHQDESDAFAMCRAVYVASRDIDLGYKSIRAAGDIMARVARKPRLNKRPAPLAEDDFMARIKEAATLAGEAADIINQVNKDLSDSMLARGL